MNAFRLLACLPLLLLSAAGVPSARQDSGFVALDVFVDAGDARLAAWQMEIRLTRGALVGVEGGDAAAFRDAPRYDPRALREDRVVIAALARGTELPAGRTRVARLHVEVSGGPVGDVTVRGVAAGDADGNRIEVGTEVRPHGDKR